MRMRSSSVWQRTFIQMLTEKERNKQTNKQTAKKKKNVELIQWEVQYQIRVRHRYSPGVPSMFFLICLLVCACVCVFFLSFFFFRRSLLLFSVTTYCYYPVYRNREHNAASFLFFFLSRWTRLADSFSILPLTLATVSFGCICGEIASLRR